MVGSCQASGSLTFQWQWEHSVQNHGNFSCLSPGTVSGSTQMLNKFPPQMSTDHQAFPSEHRAMSVRRKVLRKCCDVGPGALARNLRRGVLTTHHLQLETTGSILQPQLHPHPREKRTPKKSVAAKVTSPNWCCHHHQQYPEQMSFFSTCCQR